MACGVWMNSFILELTLHEHIVVVSQRDRTGQHQLQDRLDKPCGFVSDPLASNRLGFTTTALLSAVGRARVDASQFCHVSLAAIICVGIITCSKRQSYGTLLYNRRVGRVILTSSCPTPTRN